MINSQVSSVLENNFPIDYRSDVVKQIFTLLQKSESFSIIGMKDNCKVNVLRFLANRRDVQLYHLKEKANLYKFVLVNLREMAEINLPCFYHLLNSKLTESLVGSKSKIEKRVLNNDLGVIVSHVKRILDEYIQTANRSVVIIFNNFDNMPEADIEAISKQLVCIRQNYRFHLQFIFSGTKPFVPLESFFRKIVWMTPFSGSDTEGVLSRNLERYQVSLSETQKREIIKLSGGHSGLIKFMIQELVNSEDIDKSIENYPNNADIKFQCERIISVLDQTERACLTSKVPNELLINLGLQNNSDYSTFSPLVEGYLNDRLELEPHFVLDKENMHIYYLGREIDSKLTRQEFELLSMLIASKNSVVKRETVIDKIWEDREASDWAVDKLVSRLRNKISALTNGSQKIISHRNCGLSLEM